MGAKIGSLPVLILKVTALILAITANCLGSVPSGAWYGGCFPDTDLLTNYQDVFVPEGSEDFNTTFNEDNAVKCGSRCTAVPSVKFALFSQTGLCLCTLQVHQISASASASNCVQKVCNFDNTTEDCDGTTYHWLVNMTSLIKSVTILNSGVLKGSVPQNISIQTDPVDINVDLKIDFGDGVTVDYVQGRTMAYVYKNAGFYKVSVTAKTLSGMGTASASKVLQVETPPYGVNVSLSPLIEKGETKQYIVAIVEGNNLTVDGDIYIGNTLVTPTPVKNLAIGDAFIIAVGASANALIRASDVLSSPNTGVYIMPQFKFPTEGIVSAFEAYISKAGYLRFQIYRPSCATGLVYCYALNGCNATCSESVDMMSNITASSTIIKGVTPDFTLISEVSFVANTTGLKFFKLKSTNIEVQRGDVLGLKLSSSEGDVSHTTSASATEYHFSVATDIFPGMTIPRTSTSKTITHMITAHLSTTSSFKMTTTFAEVGVGNVKVTAKHPTLAPYIGNKYVQIQERITGLKVDEPKLISLRAYELHKATTMATSVTTGSNITYRWIIDFGAKNFTFNNTEGNQAFTPSRVGLYDLRAEAENLLSKENVTTQFKVQEKIVQVDVSGLVNGAIIARASSPIIITANVLNGTNVTLTASLEGVNNATILPNASGGVTHSFNFRPLPGDICKKTVATITAKNDIPGMQVTKNIDIAILCPITGLELIANPGFTELGGIKEIITGTDATIQVTVKLATGSFAVYSLQKDPASPEVDIKNQSTQINPTTVTFSFQYSMPKEYIVRLNITNPVSKKEETFRVKITQCPPEVLDITGSPNSLNPTQVSRGMDYKVTGTISEPNCTDPERAVIQYHIALYRIGNNVPLEEKKNVPKTELVFFIPKLKYTHGEYRVTFTQNASLAKGPQLIQKNAFVTINQSPLFATIDSGSQRIVPFKKRLSQEANTTSFYKIILDGSASRDPDDENTVLTFEWFCKGNISKPKLDARFQLCNHTEERPYLQSKWGSKMNLDTKHFQLNAKYTFTLRIKFQNRTAEYAQEISFLEGAPPAAEIGCVTNCNTKWNSQEKIILRGQCPDCVDLGSIIYNWEILYGNGTKVPGVTGTTDGLVTSTGWNKQNLVINAGQLQDSVNFKVILKAKYGEAGKNTIITLERNTASLPHSGTCEIYPKEGFVAETKYQIRCKEWKCEDLPITYQYMTKTSGNKQVEISTVSRVDYPIWYSGNEPWNPPNILPLGVPDKDYRLEMIVRIFNVYGSFRQLKPINVMVKNIKVTPEKNASSIIENSKPKTNDSVELSQWAASAASILNAEPSDVTTGSTGGPTAEDKREAEQTRTKIITSLSQANLKDISMSNLKQLGEALGTLVSKVDEINEESENIGSDFLTKMAGSFLNNKDPNAGAELLEQASAAIIGPLSDLMSATTSKSDAYLTTAKDIENENEVSPTAVTPTQSGFTTPRPTKKQIQNKAAESKKNVMNYLSVLDNVSERIFRNKVSGEVATVTKAEAFNLVLVKKKLSDLDGYSVDSGEQSYGVVLPDGIFNEIQFNGSSVSQNETEISLQGSSMKRILHTWDVDNAKDSASKIETLKMLSTDYKGYTVANLTSDITIKIENRPEKLNVTKIALNFPQEMKIRKEKIKSFDNPLLAEFASPDNSSSNLTVLIQYGFPPTTTNYDARLDITPNGIALAKNQGNVSANGTTNATLNADKPLVRNSHIRVIDDKTVIMWDFANFTYGAMGNGDMFFNFFYSGQMPDPVYVPNQYTFDILELRRSRNYTMRTFSASCLYWNQNISKWTGDGCKVDPTATTFKRTICKCNHLTSFGGFYVKPRPIPPLSADMFLKGYVLFVSVTVVLMFFILGLVLARKADKKDLLKVGVCPLPDNNPDHNYLYQITVWTGLRRDAGTKSNVYFILSGDKGDTRIRHLKDPERNTFLKNSSDVFVFSTESALGDLSHIRIWHDNSGGGWYLRKMVITDLQTDKTYQFLANRWLAVDRDDGQIEMVAPVSGKDELKEFNYVFMAKTRSDLSDSHLWFSLYARSPRSPFTRCQRLACCMSLLMTSMMTSAMFYNTYPKPTPETANYAAGLTFTWKQVYVAIISAAITVPINIIIVTLFRSSKPKDVIEIQKRGSSKAGSKASLADNTSMKSVDSLATLNSPESPVFNQNGQQPLLQKKNELEEKKDEKENQKKKESYLFPYWCVYVGWGLAFIGIVSSSVVVILYGMVFGNSVSLEWLSSIILGFIQDIVVIQPIKIFAIALFFAAIIKNVQDERPQVEEQGRKLAEDEEWLHAHADTSIGTAVDTTSLRPPEGLKLDAMRELRFKERKMYAIVREILLYTFFVLVTFSISYSLREEVGFWQTNGLERLFNLPTKETGQFAKDQFSGVLSYNDFWQWSDKVLVGQLFPTPWYDKNADYPQKTKDFPGKLLINDLNHKIVNGVRLRQVRVKKDSCKKAKLVKDVISIDCSAPYGLSAEDQSHSIYNWTNDVEDRPTITRENQPWLYQKWNELDGYPFMAELTSYFGGGYTQDLFPRWPNKENLEKLKRARWIDRHTRAVIIEFALFNPSTNHFSMVTITFEFAATGGCIHYYSIYTFKLYRYTTGYAFFTIVCEVLFLLLLLMYLYREGKEWYQLRAKYFTQFWNLVEVIINLLSIVAIGFYFYRQKLASDLLRRLPAKKPQTFINFQFAAYIDQIFIYIVSLIVFFVSIKFVKLLRFNRRMSILAETLKDAWYPLGMFSIVMGIVLTSTFAFATIVFGRHMYGYRNMLVTAATQISLLLGKFNFYEYQDTNRVIGPIFFLLYIIMVNWILLNMFLSIINDSYEVVSSGLKEQSNDYEIVDFVMDQFKAWIGYGKTRKEEIQQNIRWQSATKKMNALRAFSAASDKKGVHWGDKDVLSGLTSSVYWHENPTIFEKKDLDSNEINKTVDRFIECINLLYFDDTEVAEKMSKKVKQEISDYDFLKQQKQSEKE